MTHQPMNPKHHPPDTRFDAARARIGAGDVRGARAELLLALRGADDTDAKHLLHACTADLGLGYKGAARIAPDLPDLYEALVGVAEERLGGFDPVTVELRDMWINACEQADVPERAVPLLRRCIALFSAAGPHPELKYDADDYRAWLGRLTGEDVWEDLTLCPHLQPLLEEARAEDAVQYAGESRGWYEVYVGAVIDPGARRAVGRTAAQMPVHRTASGTHARVAWRGLRCVEHHHVIYGLDPDDPEGGSGPAVVLTGTSGTRPGSTPPSR